MVNRLKNLALPAVMAAALACGAGAVASAGSATRLAAGPSVPPVPLASCVPVAAALAAPSAFPQPAVLRPVGQVRHFPRQNLTVSASTTTEGEIQLDARGEDLGFRKKVRANGGYTLELEAPRDKVVLGVTEERITVTRGKKTITLTAETADDQMDDVRRLLADSKAVLQLRSVSAEFEASDDDSPASAAFLMSDALVGALAGDVGAPRRVARRLSRHAGTQLRPVATRPNTCYYQWEQTLLWAFMEFEECTYIQNTWVYWCSARWTLQAESAWFSFISCSGLGLGFPS